MHTNLSICIWYLLASLSESWNICGDIIHFYFYVIMEICTIFLKTKTGKSCNGICYAFWSIFDVLFEVTKPEQAIKLPCNLFIVYNFFPFLDETNVLFYKSKSNIKCDFYCCSQIFRLRHLAPFDWKFLQIGTLGAKDLRKN